MPKGLQGRAQIAGKGGARAPARAVAAAAPAPPDFDFSQKSDPAWMSTAYGGAHNTPAANQGHSGRPAMDGGVSRNLQQLRQGGANPPNPQVARRRRHEGGRTSAALELRFNPKAHRPPTDFSVRKSESGAITMPKGASIPKLKQPQRRPQQRGQYGSPLIGGSGRLGHKLSPSEIQAKRLNSMPLPTARSPQDRLGASPRPPQQRWGGARPAAAAAAAAKATGPRWQMDKSKSSAEAPARKVAVVAVAAPKRPATPIEILLSSEDEGEGEGGGEDDGDDDDDDDDVEEILSPFGDSTRVGAHPLVPCAAMEVPPPKMGAFPTSHTERALVGSTRYADVQLVLEPSGKILLREAEGRRREIWESTQFDALACIALPSGCLVVNDLSGTKAEEDEQLVCTLGAGSRTLVAKLMERGVVRAATATEDFLVRENAAYVLRQRGRRRSRHNKYDGSGPPILEYPVGHRGGTVALRARELALLEPDEFLNDSLIDFYLSWFCRERLDPAKASDVYVFSTHFFSRLCENYDNVKTWMRKKGLFDKRLLLVPVNKDAHWSLAVVTNPGEPSRCRLYLLDSLSAHSRALVRKHLSTYLANEWGTAAAIKGLSGGNEMMSDEDTQAMEEGVRQFKHLKCEQPRVPQQSTSSDCGVFLLLFAKAVLAQAAGDLDVVQMFRRMKLSERHIGTARAKIRQLLFKSSLPPPPVSPPPSSPPPSAPPSPPSPPPSSPSPPPSSPPPSSPPPSPPSPPDTGGIKRRLELSAAEPSPKRIAPAPPTSAAPPSSAAASATPALDAEMDDEIEDSGGEAEAEQKPTPPKAPAKLAFTGGAQSAAQKAAQLMPSDLFGSEVTYKTKRARPSP